MDNLSGLINSFDVDELRKQASEDKPFPYFYVDNFLTEEFANEVHDSFPGYEDAVKVGRSFKAVNEVKKVQITESELFPEPIAKLNALLASKEFINKLETILNIPDLIADPLLVGGGIHETREGGRLDVHVDFNFNSETGLYRRANVLIYFNKNWKEEYGGILDLWDKEVKHCHAEVLPIFNRLACFATSEISYHGVTPIKCPEGEVRKSFATYYYTNDLPEGWEGKKHSTIFKARPSEWMRGHINMPVESAQKNIYSFVRRVKNKIKKILR